MESKKGNFVYVKNINNCKAEKTSLIQCLLGCVCSVLVCISQMGREGRIYVNCIFFMQM